tara:strand:+ start:279 stop:494 length:216 start_codon:yes stop_codon:yes gene_type:complete
MPVEKPEMAVCRAALPSTERRLEIEGRSMKRRVSVRFARLILVPMFAVITACGMYEDMQAQKRPRYEAGEH